MLFSIRSLKDIVEASDWDLDGIPMPTIPRAICEWPIFFTFGKIFFRNLYFHHQEKINEVASVLDATYMVK
jgi:hypothetical protein